MDWRNIRNGREIPTEYYSDQPYLIKTDDGAWLCQLTTGPGEEGNPGQHIISARSFDQGRTWSELVDVEPIGEREASYGVLAKAPSGRVFCFYNYNTDNIRSYTDKNPQCPGFLGKRVDMLGHFVFKYSDDHG
ncbi:MAG TPA: sialidase family protein, partial [Clostridiales bacterium]|nr:sialidase family protein [Clostridiales bacterium]